jgi:hypothetical protein
LNSGENRRRCDPMMDSLPDRSLGQVSAQRGDAHFSEDGWVLVRGSAIVLVVAVTVSAVCVFV